MYAQIHWYFEMYLINVGHCHSFISQVSNKIYKQGSGTQNRLGFILALIYLLVLMANIISPI